MTETAKPKAPNLAALEQQLKDCETITDLYKLASSVEWARSCASISPEQVETLRGVYRACQTQLDGKVKLEQFNDQIIRIVGVEWWHSDTWDNDGVTLRFQPETAIGHTYKALTSSAVIVRFCNRFADVLPTPDNYQRAHIKLESVRDAERAAKGQRQWTIRALPTIAATTGSPF